MSDKPASPFVFMECGHYARYDHPTAGCLVCRCKQLIDTAKIAREEIGQLKVKNEQLELRLAQLRETMAGLDQFLEREI